MKHEQMNLAITHLQCCSHRLSNTTGSPSTTHIVSLIQEALRELVNALEELKGPESDDTDASSAQ